MATSMSRLSRRLRRYIERERISLNRFAELSGISHTSVKNIAAERTSCSLHTLDKIAEAMGVKPSKLIE